MNRNQSYGRSGRDRYQGDTSRQSEQFSDADDRYGDDRGYSQMGEGGSRGGYGQGENETYGANRGGWAGDRSNRGWGGDRTQGGYDRQRGSYSDQGSGYSARGSSYGGGYGGYGASEGRGYGSFTGSDFGGQDFAQRRGYGAGRSPSDPYGAYGGTSSDWGGYGEGTYDRREGYGAGSAYDSQARRSADWDPRSNERGFFARAGDEVASWFGDEEAARRRENDHSGRGPANYTRSDERILEDSCDRLTEDRGVDASNIQVTVQAGEVTLDGTVSSRQHKRRAEDVVDSISGVKHVQNNLRVQQGTDQSLSGTSGRSGSNQSLSETSYDRTDNTSGTLG